uniref:Uncharacterized protein n=1 Tax=Ciona savignyi TaxID=51511 RepID=H2Y9U6_CIOSA
MICFSCGNSVKFLQVSNGSESVFQPDGNGVSQVASSSHHRMFAVAEEGLNPSIMVYDFPHCEQISILQDGAMLGYSQLH